MGILARLLGAAKATTTAVAGAIRFPRTGKWGLMWVQNTALNIRRRVGDGSSNSIVMACRNWVERTWPEAPLVVLKLDAKSGEWKRDDAHPLAIRLRKPNPFYSGRQLLMATVADRMLTGNAYWIKVRAPGGSGLAAGRVTELWWAPSWMMRPYWPEDDDTVFVSEYWYSPGQGEPTHYPVEDVVHFRRGFDPKNIRLGRDDLAMLLGEVFTDAEASAMTAALMANLGVPGVVISPSESTDATDEELDEIKEKFAARFSGDDRGKPMVMAGPTEVKVLSWSPDQMNLKDIRRIPEERVTAVLGIPAIVTGLGAGLDHSIYNNVSEAREAAYESHIMPDHALFDDDLNLQLLPDFDDDTTTMIGHDYSKVRVLQPDQDKQHTRARGNWLSGIWTLNQALVATGEEPLSGPEGEVRAIPNIVTLTAPGALALPAPSPVPSGDGNPPTTSPADDTAASGPKTRALVRYLLHAATANGHTNGNGKAVATISPADLGEPLSLTDADLDALSEIGLADLPDAARLWNEAAAGTGLEGLLDAQQSTDNTE